MATFEELERIIIMSELVQTAEAELVPVPVPFMKGKFAIFETPQGGLHIAYRLDGTEEDKHIDLPPAMIKMAEMMGDKLPFGLGK